MKSEKYIGSMEFGVSFKSNGKPLGVKKWSEHDLICIFKRSLCCIKNEV